MLEANLANPDHSPSKLYYGWVMLPLSMLAMAATSAGQTFGISAFNKEIGQSLHLTETELAKAYMLGTILGAIPIAYFGHLMDRFGLRRTVLVTITMFAVACVLLAYTTSWAVLVVAFCLLRMLGPGTLAMLSGNMMAFWFQRRLGAVEAIRKLSISVSMGAVPALNYWLLQHLSWRQAYLVWGVAIWVGLFPLFLLLFRNHPEDVGQSLESRERANRDQPAEPLTGFTLKEALGTSAFWALTCGAGLFALVMTAVVFNRISIMEQQGLNELESAVMMAALSVTWAIVQFISSNLVDLYPARPLMAIGLFLFSLGVAGLCVVHSRAMVLVVGCTLGAAQGFFSGASHPLWARQFGRLHLGKITGIWMTAMVAASASGPYFAGTIRDYTGSFEIPLIVFAILPWPVIILTLMANFSPPPLRLPISS